jgi:hypothetical protein
VASLDEICLAIKETLENNISGINVYPEVMDAVVAPAIVIFPSPVDYLLTFGNSSTPWEFDLVLAVPGDDVIAQKALKEFYDSVGDRSIAATLLANQMLGRDDCSLKKPVTGSDYGARITFGDNTYVGAKIHIGVVTTHR